MEKRKSSSSPMASTEEKKAVVNQEKTTPTEIKDSEDILIKTISDRIFCEPEDGLISTRKKRTSALLGDNSELVSIVVQGYNRLEKTKKSVECILKYTTDIDYELLLFDNGSNDGTFEYFITVEHPKKKVFRITKNLGSCPPIIYDQYQGRYLTIIGGDLFVTKNWLTNLLTCLKSDDEIGMVAALATNFSGLQRANITFNSLEEMHEKAAEYNVSNPNLWHERIALLDPGAVYKREAIELTGIRDTGYYHDFFDNDFALRIRRSGFKTVLCKDTIVHHDHVHSNPGEKDLKALSNSIEHGRKSFRDKFYGIDGWDDFYNFEQNMISMVNPQSFIHKQNIEVLGVDVMCGTPILEVKNKFREAGIYNTQLSAFTTDPKYWLDLKTICKGDVVVDRTDYFGTYYKNTLFDYIIMGQPINSYPNYLSLLSELSQHLSKEGHLLLKLMNTFDIVSFLKTMGINLQINTKTTPFENVLKINIDVFIEKLRSIGLANTKIIVENWPIDNQVQEKMRNIFLNSGLNNQPNEMLARSFVHNYVIDIVKK